MASFNRVILVGNLTRTPELRHIPSGTAVTDIGLAVNDRRKNLAGEWVDETTFVDITLWGRTAEIAAEYLTKGSPVLVEGRLKLDTWEAEGQKRSKLKVIGEKMSMLNSGGGGGGNRNDDPSYSRPASSSSARSQQAAPQDYYDTPSSEGDDVPF
ncbi:MAG: single-stranded DNA-binding protein [Planctomycetaceae bacterium]|jgi:single-strand DNA-binding protein|nr:single-stranded DNA-binding protein [Planctomycetaceae bacterium]